VNQSKWQQGVLLATVSISRLNFPELGEHVYYLVAGVMSFIYATYANKFLAFISQEFIFVCFSSSVAATRSLSRRGC